MQQTSPSPIPDLFDAYQVNQDLHPGAESFEFHLRTMGQFIHRLNAARGWWTDLATGLPLQRNVGELLMLTVSELAEAMEGHRKGLMDDKLPHRPMFEVELADCFIRLLDMATGLGFDLSGAVTEKLRYNFKRPDHDPANRAQPNGKKY